jgi:hypothetical protein
MIEAFIVVKFDSIGELVLKKKVDIIKTNRTILPILNMKDTIFPKIKLVLLMNS